MSRPPTRNGFDFRICPVRGAISRRDGTAWGISCLNQSTYTILCNSACKLEVVYLFYFLSWSHPMFQTWRLGTILLLSLSGMADKQERVRFLPLSSFSPVLWLTSPVWLWLVCNLLNSSPPCHIWRKWGAVMTCTFSDTVDTVIIVHTLRCVYSNQNPVVR